jgi:hypothetical protein
MLVEGVRQEESESSLTSRSGCGKGLSIVFPTQAKFVDNLAKGLLKASETARQTANRNNLFNIICMAFDSKLRWGFLE